MKIIPVTELADYNFIAFTTYYVSSVHHIKESLS